MNSHEGGRQSKNDARVISLPDWPSAGFASHADQRERGRALDTDGVKGRVPAL
jgi:hypothetical protein